jgi:hypothetical protein
MPPEMLRGQGAAIGEQQQDGEDGERREEGVAGFSAREDAPSGAAVGDVGELEELAEDRDLVGLVAQDQPFGELVQDEDHRGGNGQQVHGNAECGTRNAE